jgi:hypothetical protein
VRRGSRAVKTDDVKLTWADLLIEAVATQATHLK